MSITSVYRRFFTEITLNVDAAMAGRSNTVPLLREGRVGALHKMLWLYQDEISNYFTATRMHTNLSRRLATLLAQIGPPENRPNEPQYAKTLPNGGPFRIRSFLPGGRL